MPSYQNHYEVLQDVEYAAAQVDSLKALKAEIFEILDDARRSGLLPDHTTGWSEVDDAYDAHVKSMVRSRLRHLRDQPFLWGNTPPPPGVVPGGEEKP